jgi:4-amino-4-deoxy-L-arabinose transferase-like glycosyltransferase
MSGRFYAGWWVGLWLTLVGVSLLCRPPLPVDETRYAGIAWEMWVSGDFLVPHLNGEAYSDKAPLLFWLVDLGWLLFGVNEWWPRLLPALFALAAVFLTGHLARYLWPQRPDIARVAPTLLVGTSGWVVYTPMLMFDMLLVCWVLLAVSGLLAAQRDGGWTGWLVFALATALGLLTKGPVMLLHVLPPGMLLPLLSPPAGRRWYIRLGVTTGVAVLLALTWAVPAALHGGDAYARAIFWGQTSGRMVDSFAHEAPWWWYLVLLPLVLFPWLYWPRVWRGLRALRGNGDQAARLCALWFAAVLFAFSLISGKRLHYLLPMIPVLTLLAARGLSTADASDGARAGPWPISLLFATVAGACALIPHLQPHYRWPAWTAGLPLWLSAALFVAAAIVITGRRNASTASQALRLSAVMVVSFSLTEVTFASVALPYYDLRPIGHYLHEQQEKGVPLATVGKYHDQFHFLGRLTRPLIVLTEQDAPAWAREHPDGLVIAYYDDTLPDVPVEPRTRSSYRGGWLAVWRGEDAAAYPAVLRAE